jgi:hypothetical protein
VVRKWLIIVIEEKVMAGLRARDAGVDFAHFQHYQALQPH